MARQPQHGYRKSSLIGTAIFRIKFIKRGRLASRPFGAQQNDVMQDNKRREIKQPALTGRHQQSNGGAQRRPIAQDRDPCGIAAAARIRSSRSRRSFITIVPQDAAHQRAALSLVRCQSTSFQVASGLKLLIRDTARVAFGPKFFW